MIAWALPAIAAEYRPIAIEARTGYYAADKAGVSDATRVGVAVSHRRLVTPGPLAIGVGVPFVYGHSEQAGYSYRLGGQVEIAWPIPKERLAPYVETGVHYFVSQGWDEVRFGPMWRAGVGLRLFGEGHWEIGAEPIAIERLPKGPGPDSPLRSRWGWDLTFLTLGVTW
jgi:hypothetical protein